MKTVQRERRYVCGQTKQNAVYQEIEIYTVGTDQKSRQREKQKVTPVPFRGKNPEHWDGHNAKRARKWFIRLLNTNFTEADTHTSLQDFVLAWTETILNPWVMPKKKQKEIA